MIRETLVVGLLRCNCSILGDEVSRQAIVVDPGDDIAQVLAIVAKHGLSVKRIIVTHAHIDHIAGADALRRATGASVSYHSSDLPMAAMMAVQASWLGVETPVVAPLDEEIEDGDTIRVGNLIGTILHTPGHTPGSICLYLPEEALLLAGDTLFAGTVGRTDLPGGESHTLIKSIHEQLMTLPDATVVLPGHGQLTSIGVERESNPFL